MTIRVFGRCIEIGRVTSLRLPGKPPPRWRFLSGGQAASWPWWWVQFGRFELTVSRVQPRNKPSSTRT